MISINIEKIKSLKNNLSTIFLVNSIEEIKEEFSKEELSFIKSKIKTDETVIKLQNLNTSQIIVLEKKDDEAYITSENWRKSGSKAFDLINSEKNEEVNIISNLKKKKNT